jgi:uncharacterized membrane protein (DUF4010 family)
VQLSHWQPYLIAAIIGLLVGIEREKSHPKSDSMGVRTFILMSMLGAIAGGLQSPWLPELIAAFAFGLILISYFNQTKGSAPGIDRGLTTEFAAGIIFCSGYAAHQSPILSAMMGPLVAILLFSKRSLHRFTNAVRPAELQAALLLLLGGVMVVELAPNKLVDPWGIFNPRKFGYLILTLAVIEFSSYLLAKIVGEKKGAFVSGFLGGLVSSTAVLLSSARRSAKNPENWHTLLSSAIAATLASLLELLLIVGLISHELFLRIAPPIGAGATIGGLSLFFLISRKIEHDQEQSLKSPLDWKGILRLSVLLGAILASISVAQLWLGDQATLAVSFLTGLFELHGVSLANATLFSQGQLSVESAGLSIIIAAIGSLMAKISISWAVNRGGFARGLSLILIPMAGFIALTAWLTIG